jgi:hypothetical protein
MPFGKDAFNGVLQLCHVVQLGSPTDSGSKHQFCGNLLKEKSRLLSGIRR